MYLNKLERETVGKKKSRSFQSFFFPGLEHKEWDKQNPSSRSKGQRDGENKRTRLLYMIVVFSGEEISMGYCTGVC